MGSLRSRPCVCKRIGRGKIVNLHDSRLKGYDWTHVGYILSKHVLAAMTRMMALEFAPDITVNAVAFLVQSDFVTGNVIYVDGGRHLHEYSDGSNPH